MSAQRIIWGLDHLGTVLDQLGGQRVLLVADASFPHLSVKERILEAVRPQGCFTGFHSNPDYTDICRGIECFTAGGFDALVAVGGGSAMDVAKCIKLAVKAPQGASCLIPPLVWEQVPVADAPAVPLLAIPTTAGTGAESTGNAVHYYEGVKQTVTHPCIRPDAAFLEPSVLDTLPLYQKKCTMMDALCQGIESWWSVAATPESRSYSRAAVEGIMCWWRAYIFDNEPSASREIMLAANFGGRAIHIAHTTSAHAMSYKLGSLFDLPHGHAVAVCLPEIWDYMIAVGSPGLQAVFGDIAAAMGALDASHAVVVFREMMSSLALERPAGGANRQEQLEELARQVNPTRMRNNPVILDSDTCKLLYDKILR